MPKGLTSTRFVAALLLSLAIVLVPVACLPQEQWPPEVVRLMDQAGRLQKQGQQQLAIPYFSKAIKLAPQNASIYQRRGAAYNAVSNFQPAVQDFNQALKLDDRLTEAYMGRAWAYDQLDKFAAAVKDYEKYLSFNNARDRAFAGCCLADNLGQLGQTNKAIKVLNDVLEHDPKNAQARRQRGTFLNSDLGNPKQAVVDFSVAIAEKERNYRDIYALRASAYKRIKDYSKAIADYTTVIKLSPRDDNACRERAAVYELMGDDKKAIEDYSAGIERNPEWAGPNYFSRARCYKKLGQNALAQKDLEECRRLNYGGK